MSTYKNKALLSKIGLFYRIEKGIVDFIIQYIIIAITNSYFCTIYI